MKLEQVTAVNRPELLQVLRLGPGTTRQIKAAYEHRTLTRVSLDDITESLRDFEGRGDVTLLQNGSPETSRYALTRQGLTKLVKRRVA